MTHAMKTSVYPDSKVANKEFEVVNNIQFLFTLSWLMVFFMLPEYWVTDQEKLP